MAFKMKSGNKPGFKGMGSSPVKAYNSPAYKTEDTSKLTNKEKQDNLRKVIPNEEAFNKLSTTERGNFTKSWANAGGVTKQVKKSPAKQRLNKGGEGQDQNKIFDKNGKHVGDYVNGKKVMKSTKSAHGQLNDAERDFKRDTERALKAMDKKSPSSKIKEGSKSPAKQAKKSGLGPSTAFGGVKNPELVKTKKTKSKKVMKDGPKNRVHGAGDTGNWQPHQFKSAGKKRSPAKQLKGSGHGPATKFDKKRYPVGNPELTDKNPFKKDDYYYKINGKAATKAAYLKYENKPGKMEGGGKQTNNPDVYGRKKGGSPSNPK